MSSKGEFYVALDHLRQAAKDAVKAMPDDLNSREKKLWQFLSRLSDQIEDIKASLDDPHTRTDLSNRNTLLVPGRDF